ncbi:MAG: VOC family protein [Bacteroidetes bacterium]|nr:VOC family protein [Bacteroidota bacterium]
MLTAIIPKLPMRDRTLTYNYYVEKLGFKYIGSDDFEQYLIVEKDDLQIHFFEFKTLDPKENYGQIYIRTNNVDKLYQDVLENNVEIHPNGHLENKPWQQREFSLLDPDNNLLTFGQDKS